MKVKIFYSWQSDTEKSYNWHFIEEALKKAIKIVKYPPYQFDDVLIDRDTKNLPGTPSIPDSVKNKINECQIFLADLTIINAPKAPNENGVIEKLYRKFVRRKRAEDAHMNRLQPNGNVMFEYGQAEAVIGEERIICVMNEHYAEANSENILFDLRHKRWPITYTYSSLNAEDRNNVLDDLSKSLANAISSILKFGLNNPNWDYFPFLDWNKWGNEMPDMLNYFQSENIEGLLLEIPKLVSKNKSVLRIVGLSGLGKTRMVYEAFNPHRNSKIREQYNQVLYLDLNKATNDYINILTRLTESKERKIIILDNCNDSIHLNVMEIVRKTNSLLSLITIDFNPITNPLERITAHNLIELNPEDFEEVIDKILLDFFPDEDEREEREKIKLFSKGHTLIATLLAIEKRENPMDWKPIITNRRIIDKLLGSDGDDGLTKKILTSISIFDKLGHFDELAIQTDYVAESPLLSKLDLKSGIALNKFREVCFKYQKRGLIERKARYISVRPKPLAISLAVDWWSACDEDYIKQVFEALATQQELKEALIEQFKYLDFLEDAQRTVRDLVGPEGPFGKAEVLNTEEGSRLFRSLVEVNPLASVETLSRVFGGKTKEELLEVIAGRRNLVWALEKLCFRKETFEKSAKVLMQFAIAENENYISNNSKYQFYHLFQVYLAGTEASLAERISIIEYALSKKNSDYTELAIGALVRAIQTTGFSRMEGAETQGSSTKLKDYQPSYKEITEYFKHALNRLFNLRKQRPDQYSYLVKEIINSIRSFYKMRLGFLILPIVEDIIKEDESNWVEIRNKFYETLSHEKANLSEKEEIKLKNIAESLRPKDFRSRYISFVKKSSWNDFDELKDYSKKPWERIFLLADELLEGDIDYKEFISLFNEGEQQFGFYFGQRIAEKGDIEFVNTLFQDSLNHLCSIEAAERNISVIAGLLSNLDEERKVDLFRELTKRDELANYSFSMAAMIRPDAQMFDTLFSLLDQRALSINEFRKFIYGRALDHLSLDYIQRLSQRIMTYGRDGAYTTLAMLFMYSWHEEAKWEAVKLTIRQSLMQNDLLFVEGYNHLERHYWADAVIKLLSATNDIELANHISNEIVILCKSSQYVSAVDNDLKKVLELLLTQFFDVAWNKIAALFNAEGEEGMSYFNLQSIIGSHISSYGNEIGVLFKSSSLDTVFDWAKSNRELGARRLINISPIFNDNTFENWHPFTKRLIDEFGSDNLFLKELSANFGSYSWSGSLVPLLESQKRLVDELMNHEFSEVKKWATGMSEYLESRLKKERNEDIEQYL